MLAESKFSLIDLEARWGDKAEAGSLSSQIGAKPMGLATGVILHFRTLEMENNRAGHRKRLSERTRQKRDATV